MHTVLNRLWSDVRDTTNATATLWAVQHAWCLYQHNHCDVMPGNARGAWCSAIVLHQHAIACCQAAELCRHCARYDHAHARMRIHNSSVALLRASVPLIVLTLVLTACRGPLWYTDSHVGFVTASNASSAEDNRVCQFWSAAEGV
jgi:hypothetical protein